MGIREGNTRDLTYANRPASIFLMGPPRSGKTWFASTAPDPYWIATDRGLTGLGDAGIEQPFSEVDTLDDLLECNLQIWEGKRAKERKTIVLDDLGSITELCIHKVKSGKTGYKGVGHIAFATMRRNDWPDAVSYLHMAVKSFIMLRDKGFNVILLARSILYEDRKQEGSEDSPKYFMMPETVGQFRSAVAGYFDFAFEAEYRGIYDKKKQVVVPSPVIKTVPNNMVKAIGARTAPGRFPPEFPNNWTSFWDILTSPPKLTERPEPKATKVAIIKK